MSCHVMLSCHVTPQLDTSGTCSYTGLAYLWLETPCTGEAQCPLYSADQYSLPVAPFKMDL